VGLVVGLAIMMGAADLPQNRGIGQSVANFTLNDIAGRPVSLNDFRGKKAIVLAFLGTDCPVSNLYAPRLAELSKAYRDQGVVFLGINSNARETVDQVAAHAKAYGLGFPVLKDPANLVADQTLAERTCEVLVLDGQRVLRYRGAIDDQYALGSRKAAASKNYLRDALDRVLAGKPVETPATAAVGCLLDRLEPKAMTQATRPQIRPASATIAGAGDETEKDGLAAADVGPVTYAAHVAVILRDRCQACHRPGQVGPFSLLSYDDARRHAAMIREVVADRRMPPWHADPRYGHFRNDRRLSARERATLLAWVDQGTPLGDAAAIPKAKSFPKEWTVGTPDTVFELPEPYVVPAQGVVDYVNLRVPSHFAEDKLVQAAEAIPGDRSVVHHIAVYIDDHSRTGGTGVVDSYAFLCGYVPGDLRSGLPVGTAKRIPAGSDFVFQIHYTPNGKIRTDRTKLGLTFAKGAVKQEVYTGMILQSNFKIPPGVDNYPVEATYTLPRDIRVLGFMPHMHYRGKSFQYEATFPDGHKQRLLSVPAYDFGWQAWYYPTEPLALPKGTKIDCLALFDNSAGNPANPDPAKSVSWGEQTFEEMMIGFIEYVDDGPIATQPLNKRSVAGTTRRGHSTRTLLDFGASNSTPSGTTKRR